MKTIVIEATTCPICGKPMPARTLAGLCPGCLLAQGAAAESGDSGHAGRFVPPPLEEIAKLFPQLEILGLLGAGGMGAVYKARQPALDRIVALKVLPSHNAEGVNFAERFNREARALARLNHPNIVAVYEFGDAGGLHFFIMEFVDGANLRQLEQAGRLAPREALQIIPQICDALQYAHDEGVVHRDIKPENVLVDRKGRVKIADFGLAKILGQETDALRLTAEGQVMGTPHYMAPEQVEKPLSVDHRADIYALGVVFYEMLTGDLPLGKFSPPSRKYQLDVRLDDVVLRALENDPARRYQQASEVKTQVENIAGSPPSATPPAPVPEQKFIRWAGFPLAVERDGERKVNRREALKAFGILFGVLTVVFGVVSLITGRTHFGWLGISGGLSLQVRLLIAGIVTAFGVLWAWRVKPVAAIPPQTPEGTVILPPERFSRKAIIGACWIPFILFAMATMVAIPAAQAATRSGPTWWQIALAVLTLPLAFTAPFGATILGWLAVSDIRRSRGRISGLPLAVFDGLFFPLVVLDVFVFLGVRNGFHWFTATQLDPSFKNPPPELVTLGALLVCALVDFLIVRRVWRAVKLTPTAPRLSRDWWWSRKPGAIAIGVACVIVVLAATQRRAKPGIFKNPPDVTAVRDSSSGVLVATLPGGAQIELLAISDGVGATAPDEWWKADGSRHLNARFEVRNAGRITTPNLREKDFIFRFSRQDLFPPVIECNPGSAWVSGGQAYFDGNPIPAGYPLRFAWPEGIERTTMRVGVSLVPWRSTWIYDPKIRSTRGIGKAGDPQMQVDFHDAGEHEGQAVVTMVRSHPDGKWQSQVIAIGTNGLEYFPNRSSSTPAPKQVVWAYTFPLPLSAVKEFHVQIRPLYWVEFPDVALVGRGVPMRRTAKTPAVKVVASHDRAKGRMVLNLQPRGTVELLGIADWDAAPNAWWNPQGNAIPDTLFEVVNPERPQDITRQNRHLVLRMRDLPAGADGPQIELVDAWGGSGGSSILRDGKPLSGGWLVRGSFPAGVTEGTMRLGFGLSEFRTIYTSDASGSNQQRLDVPGVPQLETRVHQVSEADGEAQITMLMGYATREWQVRVVAIDTEGKEHVTVSSRGSHAHEDQVSVWSYRFWKLPLARVKEFQVRVRPVQWFEFQGIPLHPQNRSQLGQSARALQATAWSAEKEVHVTEYFDFDKGVSGAFPTAADGTKTYRNVYRNPSWSRENGFDVEAGTNELRTPQMFVIDLQPSDWDTISIPDFEKKMNVYYGPPVLPSMKNAKLPLTHGFKTAEGALGILQITGFDPGKVGVHLRYKIIERARLE
jgi:predicted Ser/Thr protein kinase